MFNKLYANIKGYFWLPCPICGNYFGGHEWNNRDGLWTSGSMRTGVCNNCVGLKEIRLRNIDFFENGGCDAPIVETHQDSDIYSRSRVLSEIRCLSCQSILNSEKQALTELEVRND